MAAPPLPADRGTRTFRLYSALTFAFAWVPVMYTHFTVTRGWSPDEYASLWSTYYLAMVACELPWGWLADRIGRRPVLVAGPLVLGAAFLLLGQARSLAEAHLLMAVVGGAHALISGADSAWLYDHVAAAGRPGDAFREEAVAHRWRLFGVCVLDVLGGCVAFWLGTPAAFELAAGVMVVSASLAAWLPEERAAGGRPRPSVAAARAALGAPGVPWVLGWFVAVFVLLRTGFQLYQPTLIAAGATDLRLHGLVLGGLNLAAGLSVYVVLRVFGALGERRTAGFVLLLLAVSFAGLSAAPGWLMPMLFVLQQVAFGFLQPVGRTSLNQRIRAGERASLLSAQSLLARLAFATLLFAVPWDAAFTARLPVTYLVLAGVALLAAVLAVTLHPEHRTRLESALRG
jgi:MFS family permease